MSDKTKLRDALMQLSLAVDELRNITQRDYTGMQRKYPKIMGELNQANESALSLLRDVMGIKNRATASNRKTA